MKKSNSALHRMAIILLMFLLVFAVGWWGPPESVEKAKKELELFYIKQDYYMAVDVKSAKVDGEYYIFCSPADPNADFGGLYWVDQDEESKGYTIYTANGQAAQDAGFKYDKMEDIRNTSKILDHF